MRLGSRRFFGVGIPCIRGDVSDVVGRFFFPPCLGPGEVFAYDACSRCRYTTA